MTTQQIITLMLLGHLIADYTLQGCLANMKQIKWWREQTTERKYRFDYVAGLFSHSLYWSIFICAPFWSSSLFLVSILANAVIHAIIDDLKCNRFKLNLIQDQLLHLSQIAVTFILLK